MEIKELLLQEINNRKSKAIAELETITEASKNVKVADKRRYTILQNKIKSLEKELSTVDMRYSNVIETQREQILKLNGDEELESKTEVESEIIMPDILSYDVFEFTKEKEGMEIKRLQGVNHYNETPKYYLTREHKELFIDE